MASDVDDGAEHIYAPLADAYVSISRLTWAAMAAKALVRSALGDGTSSQCSTTSPGGAISPRSHPNETTRQAVANSSRVTLLGRCPRTSMPSVRSAAATPGATPGSRSVPAEVAQCDAALGRKPLEVGGSDDAFGGIVGAKKEDKAIVFHFLLPLCVFVVTHTLQRLGGGWRWRRERAA
jgi:hypothetical protein